MDNNSSIISKMLQFAGLVGTLPSDDLLPRQNVSQQSKDASSKDFGNAGSISDPNLWSLYNKNMSQPVTYENMLQLWDQMSSWDLISATLLEIVDEATQTDSSSPGTLWYECNDTNIEDELNDMLLRVNAETVLPSQFWHVAGFGNAFEKLDYKPNEGVLGMSFVHPMEVRRYWLTRNRRCIGFRWGNHTPNKSSAYYDPATKSEIPRVGIQNGQNVEDLYYPWDFLHFRRMYRMRQSEHGEPIFAEAQGIYKKLRMAIDQMVVYRAQIQPDRYSVNIDVQDQAPVDQLKTVQRWKQQLRRRISFGDGNDAGQATDFNSFYNPMSLDSILWIAQPRGFQHSVTKLPGTESIPDVYDIEMLINLFFAVIGMPKWWVMGQADGSSNPASGRALMATDMRFMRKIKGIRQPIMAGYEWLGYFNELLRGKDISDLDIRVKMPDIGSLEDQVKMEILNTQTDVMTKLADIMDKFNLPPDIWVDIIFRKYLKVPDDIVDLIITSLPPEVQQQESERSSVSKVIREIDNTVDKRVLDEAAKRMVGLSYGKIDNSRKTKILEHRRHQMYNPDMLRRPIIQDNDIVASSFGEDSMICKGLNGAPLNESNGSSSSVIPILEKMINSASKSKDNDKKSGWRRFI